MRNLNCKLKYCPICKVRMQQGNCREEEDYVVLTRSCPQCKKSVHIIEMCKEEYNANVEVLNKIIDILAQKKGSL